MKIAKDYHCAVDGNRNLMQMKSIGENESSDKRQRERKKEGRGKEDIKTETVATVLLWLPKNLN